MKRKKEKQTQETVQDTRQMFAEELTGAEEPVKEINTVEGMECSPYAEEINWAIKVSKQYGFRMDSAIQYSLGICCTKCEIEAVRAYVRKWWDLIAV